MPRIMPEPRYLSMPSSVVGAVAFRNDARNCGPWVRLFTHAPEALTNSPAEISAAWPTAVTKSLCPRTLTRSTQKPVSALWKVTRSTSPARASVAGGAALFVPSIPLLAAGVAAWRPHRSSPAGVYIRAASARAWASMDRRRRTTAPEGRPGGGGGALLLPYGAAPDGRLVRACAVPAGLACGCACPACGAPLIARRGQVLAAHFAHAAPDRACAGALETALHRLAKQLIADGAALTLPEVAAEHDGVRHVVRPATTVRTETATLEPGLDGLRPDVVAVVAGRPLLVEVAVTHACGPAKIALIRQRRLAAIEIDLSWLARSAPEEAVERAVLHSAPRRWLWNRHAEAAEAEMRGTAARLAARRARAREGALGRGVRGPTAAAAAAPPAPADRRLVEAVGVVRWAGV